MRWPKGHCRPNRYLASFRSEGSKCFMKYHKTTTVLQFVYLLFLSRYMRPEGE